MTQNQYESDGQRSAQSGDEFGESLHRIAAALEKRNQQAEEKKDDDEGNGEKEGDEKDNEKDKKKKHLSGRTIFLIVAAVLVLVILGLFYFWHTRGRVSTDDAYTTGHVHQISARINGTVESVEVDDNQIVRQGQLLLKLDPRDNQTSRDKAAASLAQAEAQVLQAKAQVTQQQAQVDQYAAQMETNRRTYERNHSLFEKDEKAVSKSDVDTAEGNLKASQAQVASNRANVAASEANVKNAEANVGASRASLADADLQLSYTRVISPVAGRVSKRTVETGQRLTAGQALLAVVPEDVWVLANFKETQLARIVVGQRVDIKIDSLPSKVFAGVVDSIQEGTGATFSLLPPDNSTGNFTKIVQRVPVKIVFDPESIRDFADKIAPGLSCVPTVDLLSTPHEKRPRTEVKREEKRGEQTEKQNREEDKKIRQREEQKP